MRVHVDLCCVTLIVGRERRYSDVSFLNICDYINMSSYFVLCSAFFAQSTHSKVPSQVRAVSMLRLTFQIGIFSCSHQIRNGLRGLLSSGTLNTMPPIETPYVNMRNSLSVFCCTLHIWGPRNWYSASPILGQHATRSRYEVCNCPFRQCLLSIILPWSSMIGKVHCINEGGMVRNPPWRMAHSEA